MVRSERPIFDIREEWRQLHRSFSSFGRACGCYSYNNRKVVGSTPTMTVLRFLRTASVSL